MALAGLDPDEAILAWMPFSFAGSATTSVRGALPLMPLPGRRRARLLVGPNADADVTMRAISRNTGPPPIDVVPVSHRSRGRAVRAWVDQADRCGFPVVGGDMVLGVSDRRRLHVWKPRFWIARPARHGGWFPCARITQVAVAPQVVTTRLTLLIDDGTILGFESMKRARVRRFAALLDDAVAR